MPFSLQSVSSIRKSWLFATLPVVGLLLLPLASGVRAQQGEEDADPPNSPLPKARALLKEGKTDDAYRLLKTVPLATMTPEGKRRFVRLARPLAMRQGDSAWLKELNEIYDKSEGTPREMAVGYSIFAAAYFVQAGDYKRAHDFLDYMKRDLGNGSERERRRWVAISARLARLEGDKKAERKFLTELVEYPAAWATETCQQCHLNVKEPKKIPLLNVTRWWPTERYVALLKENGDAAKERDKAKRELDKVPSDNAARLRLAYALQALGQDGEAETVLRGLPWAKFPDREGIEPQQIQMFP